MYKISRFRLVGVVGIFIGLYLISCVNLFIIQIKNSLFFTSIASQQYHVAITQLPDRAEIYDRNGQPLALNKEGFSVFIVPNALQEPEKLKEFLKSYYPQALEKLVSHQDKKFMYIKRAITLQEKAIFESHNLKDINFLQEPNRFYPVPSLGHTIGITNVDNQGLSGIELIFDKELSGTPTTYNLEKEARSNFFYFKKETAVVGVAGKPVTLTIDADLQFLVYEELKNYVELFEAQEGSVLIMDPVCGDILAMACYPDFNPNHDSPNNLWLTKNRIITEAYEPGSVIKIFPALAAIEEKIVEPTTIIDCENKIEATIKGWKFSTWQACGKIPYIDVIRYSNNIGTAKVAAQLGKPLYNHLLQCGFAKKTALNFPGEQSGYITSLKNWTLATPISLSFGYEIRVTLLQLACGFSLLACDGSLVQPRLYCNQAIQQKKIYSTETINAMREIINLNHPGSTAQNGRIEGYNVMGKTGTAYLITHGNYDKNRSIYTFVGLIEKGNYKRIICTFIREPKKKNNRPLYAATIAVPLFKHVAHVMISHDTMI